MSLLCVGVESLLLRRDITLLLLAYIIVFPPLLDNVFCVSGCRRGLNEKCDFLRASLMATEYICGILEAVLVPSVLPLPRPVFANASVGR